MLPMIPCVRGTVDSHSRPMAEAKIIVVSGEIGIRIKASMTTDRAA